MKHACRQTACWKASDGVRQECFSIIFKYYLQYCTVLYGILAENKSNCVKNIFFLYSIMIQISVFSIILCVWETGKCWGVIIEHYCIV